jgi:hypothetical protein
VLGEFLTSPIFDTAYYALQVCVGECGGASERVQASASEDGEEGRERLSRFGLVSHVHMYSLLRSVSVCLCVCVFVCLCLCVRACVVVIAANVY